MGSLCRIGETSEQILLEVKLKPETSQYERIIRGIWALRKKVYREHYPEVSILEKDPHDRYSCVIYTQDPAGRMTRPVPSALFSTENWAFPVPH